MVLIKTYGGFLLSQLRQISRRSSERMLKESGVDAFNGAQGRILYVLWEHGAQNITEIAKLTGLAKTTLTSMLDRMEASDLVRREHDPNNRRQIIVSITDKARGYEQQYNEICEKANQLFYKGFSEDEIVHFENTLRAIIRNFEEEEGEDQT